MSRGIVVRRHKRSVNPRWMFDARLFGSPFRLRTFLFSYLMATPSSPALKLQASLTSERRISQSSIPCFGLSALCLSSSLQLYLLSTQLISPSLCIHNVPPSLRGQTFTPPFVLRMGFGAIFAGAGYVLASGDSRNGSGVATAWSSSYLVLEQFLLGFQRSLRLPRSRLSIALSSATAATAVLYGTEHFILGDEDSESD
ncbi:hypothetical protein BGW80DRAFT_764977 [Lactifluus volemus]|nr:hypothetical protein BGW80DRAFT_764977 [Lactifluus volemus]